MTPELQERAAQIGVRGDLWTYQARVELVAAWLDHLTELLAPIDERLRSFSALGGTTPGVSEQFRLGDGVVAVFHVRASDSGFTAHLRVIDGTVPPPDPALTVPMLLHTPELLEGAFASFARVVEWAESTAQAL